MKRFREGDDHVEKVVDINVARVLMLLSRGQNDDRRESMTTTDRVFECKTCDRRFPSFQALGGHRASHKKARVLDDQEETIRSPAKPKKVHECSICGVEFSLGQALGGHMRRHRVVSTGGPCAEVAVLDPLKNIKVKKDDVDGGDERRSTLMAMGYTLDLNLTPTENDIHRASIANLQPWASSHGELINSDKVNVGQLLFFNWG